MSSTKEKDKVRNKIYYENLTDEQKEARLMRASRRYYLKKGVIPYPQTSLAKYCKKHGYDLTKVMSGEQTI